MDGPGPLAGAFYHRWVANRRARTRIIAGSWRLPLVVLVGVLLVGVLVTLYGGVNRYPEALTSRAVTGTVVDSEPCAQTGARDTVRVEVDGRTEQLTVNACGNPDGFQLDLELLTDDEGQLTARLAGTGGQPGADLAARISAVLLVLAALAGAVLVMQLAPGHPVGPSDVVTGTWSMPVFPTRAPVNTAIIRPRSVAWPTEDPSEVTVPLLSRRPRP